MTIMRDISRRERIRLMKKMRRIEKKFEKANPDAPVLRERLMKEAAAVQRKLG